MTLPMSIRGLSPAIFRGDLDSSADSSEARVSVGGFPPFPALGRCGFLNLNDGDAGNDDEDSLSNLCIAGEKALA